MPKIGPSFSAELAAAGILHVTAASAKRDVTAQGIHLRQKDG